MDPVYFNCGELAPEMAPGVYHQPPGRYALGYDVVNPLALLDFGGVASGYAPAMFEPLPAGHVLGMHQYHAFEPIVCGTNYLPYEPQFISVLPTVFQTGLTLVESMPTAYHVQPPAGIALQPGYFEYPVAANQSGINNSANMEFIALGPNMQTLGDDYSMSGTSNWSGFEQGIVPGNGFDISSMPDGQLQQNSSRISDTAPSSSNQQQTKSGQANRNKRTRSANKLKPSVRSGIQKPSSRRIPKASAPNRSCLENKKKKAQPPATRTDPCAKFTEPVYHITWAGIAEEYEHLDDQCPICKKGLSCNPSEEDGEDGGSEYYDDSEPFKIPDVAILPCGHAFHSECLKLYTPEDQSSDPPCFLCFSSIS